MSEDRSSSESGERSWLERLAHAFHHDPKTRDELLELLSEARDNELIDQEALTIMQGALDVADQQVREIMIPRPQMVCLKIDEPLEKTLPKIIRTGHSRYPVVGENSDEVLGILLAKDLLPLILNGTDGFDMRQLLRPATFIPESKRLNVLLREFREKRNHMAVVIDEYGGVAGLITIEDVLEQIVGDIEDEYDDDDDKHVKKISDRQFIVKALMPIDEFNEQFKCDFSDEEFDTIGGLILQSFGHLPRRNEITQIGPFEFKVINAENRRLHLLRMTIHPDVE